MAASIASFTTSVAIATSVVTGKPTGLTAGDLLLAGTHMYWTGGDRQLQIPAGWTTIANMRAHNDGENVGTALAAMYKVADSSDASASTFTFTATDANSGLAVGLLRITNKSTVTSVAASSSDMTDNGGSSGVYSFPGITQPDADSMLLMFAGTRLGSGHSGYNVVTSNPSWTQLFQVNSNGFSMAFAQRPQATATSTASYSIAGSGAGTDAGGVLIAIKPTVDTSVLASVVSVPTSVFSPSVTGGSNVVPSVISVTTSVFSSVVGQADWSPLRKSDTSVWTNLSKS